MASSLSCSSSLQLSTPKGVTSICALLHSRRIHVLTTSRYPGAAFSLQAPRATVSSTTSISETKDASSPSQVQISEDPYASASTAKDWRSKGSAQLTRWARTRKLRSGKPPSEATLLPLSDPPPPYHGETMPPNVHADHDDHHDMPSPFLGRENTVYMVSDGTGWTAEHSVHAALGQFEHCLVDHGCPVSTHLFSEVPFVIS